ncbi:MAG: hypothetical protein M3311_07145 [Thermoproteota archaeon]|nr:hypothetical protein [Thermoproteota archaeon]
MSTTTIIIFLKSELLVYFSHDGLKNLKDQRMGILCIEVAVKRMNSFLYFQTTPIDSEKASATIKKRAFMQALDAIKSKEPFNHW